METRRFEHFKMTPLELPSRAGFLGIAKSIGGRRKKPKITDDWIEMTNDIVLISDAFNYRECIDFGSHENFYSWIGSNGDINDFLRK